MNELIYQPIFDESGRANGYIMIVNMFGLSGLILSFEGISVPRNWRTRLIRNIFTALFTSILMKDEHGKVPITEQQRMIREDNEWFQYELEDMLAKSNLYVYSHTPTKPNGYVRILTEPDPNEDGNLRVEEQEYYPSEVGKAGPVERFLFDFASEDATMLYWDLPLRVLTGMSGKREDYCWKLGNELQLDPDIHYLYFNDTVLWNELYWDLRQAIGRPWKECDFMEAWRMNGINVEKKLIAEHDAQRLLFWCMENDYTLDDLYQMVSEKRILTKRILGTKQDSWMTLEYGL